MCLHIQRYRQKEQLTKNDMKCINCTRCNPFQHSNIPYNLYLLVVYQHEDHGVTVVPCEPGIFFWSRTGWGGVGGRGGGGWENTWLGCGSFALSIDIFSCINHCLETTDNTNQKLCIGFPVVTLQGCEAWDVDSSLPLNFVVRILHC